MESREAAFVGFLCSIFSTNMPRCSVGCHNGPLQSYRRVDFQEKNQCWRNYACASMFQVHYWMGQQNYEREYRLK